MKFNSKNIQIGKNVIIGKDVRLGDNTVIYDNVEIGDGTIIANDCNIGEPNSNYYYNSDYSNPKTVIGKNCLIRSHTIVYCGNNIGDNLNTGHRTLIRENNSIGHHCSIGSHVEITGDSKIGNFCRIHSNVIICEHAIIGDFVMIFCYALLANSPTPPSNILIAPEIGDYSIIAVHAVLLPGSKVGKNCLVGANATVTKAFDDYSVIIGSPAKRVGDIREIPSKEKEGPHYPWMYNFERGMPWQDIGYDNWLKTQD